MTTQSEDTWLDDECEDLQEKIHIITKFQKPYIANSLKRMAQESPRNVKVICEYIIAEQNEINIKNQLRKEK
jgi:hypothetical protein